MSAQPHDRASQADLELFRQEPQPRPSETTTKSNKSYRARRRAAAKHARSTLYALRHGQAVAPVQAATRPESLYGRLARSTGQAAVRALVLALVLVAVGGLPAGAYRFTPRRATVRGAASAIEQQEQRVAQHAPVVFAPVEATPVSPAELSSGGLIDLPVALTGDGGLSPKSAAIQNVAPPVATAPQAQERSPFSAVHVVANGETLGAIAQQYNVSVTALAAANAVDPRLLPSGSRLRIPQTPGVPHIVREGETIETIAAQYGVPAETVTTFSGADQNRTFAPGDEIFVPGATLSGLPAEEILAAVPARPVAVVRDDKTNIRSGPATAYPKLGYLGATTPVMLLGQHNGWFKLLTVEGSEGWVAAELLAYVPELAAQLPVVEDIPPLPTPAPVPPAEAPKAVARWVWPAGGDFTSGFGYRNFSVGRNHNGVDIANGRGTPIRAARSGRVTAAGWCGGYGYCVKIDHGDGLVTLYAHMYAAPIVAVGQYVEAGQKIGGMGMTYGRGGYASGVHLHFTILLGGKAVNPLKYLP